MKKIERDNRQRGSETIGIEIERWGMDCADKDPRSSLIVEKSSRKQKRQSRLSQHSSAVPERIHPGETKNSTFNETPISSNRTEDWARHEPHHPPQSPLYQKTPLSHRNGQTDLTHHNARTNPSRRRRLQSQRINAAPTLGAIAQSHRALRARLVRRTAAPSECRAGCGSKRQRPWEQRGWRRSIVERRMAVEWVGSGG